MTVPPESGVPLDPEVPEPLPELELPELELPELLPELALPDPLPDPAPPELLPVLALPELPPDPSLSLDPEPLAAPESDSSCPPLASGREFDGPALEPQEERAAVAADRAKSQRARIGSRSLLRRKPRPVRWHSGPPRATGASIGVRHAGAEDALLGTTLISPHGRCSFLIEQFTAIEKSAVEWTIARPPRLVMTGDEAFALARS